MGALLPGMFHSALAFDADISGWNVARVIFMVHAGDSRRVPGSDVLVERSRVLERRSLRWLHSTSAAPGGPSALAWPGTSWRLAGRAPVQLALGTRPRRHQKEGSASEGRLGIRREARATAQATAGS